MAQLGNVEGDNMSPAELRETVRQQRDLIEMLKEGIRQKDEEWRWERSHAAQEVERLRERVSEMQFQSIMRCGECQNVCSCAKVRELEVSLSMARCSQQRRSASPSHLAMETSCKRAAPDFSQDLVSQLKRLRISTAV